MSGSQGAFLNALDPLSGMTNPFEFSNQVSQARKNALDVENQQGQKVWGQALLKNTDANGNVDYQGAARDAAAAGGPAAAMAARSALGDMGNQRGQQIINAAGMYKTVGIGAMGLAKDPSDANVNAVFDNMAASGLPAAQVNAERQRVLAMTNPVDRQNYAMQHGLSVLDQLHQVVGQTTLRDVGGTVAPVTVNQPTANSTGGATVGPGSIPITPSPDQLAQQISYVDDQGVTQHTTLGEYHKKLGIGAPPAGTPPPSVPVPGSASPPSSAAKSIPGPEPGMAEKWKASADQYNAANEVAASYQQRIFPLVQAASILKSGDVTTGQGAEAFNHVKSFLMTQATNLGADAQTIQQADFDKTAKYLQQYVNQQGMSGRSDQALASAISGNPSAHISTLANQQILPAMLGMERMRQSIITDFKAQNGQPKNFSDYAADWQNKHDPRAFIFDQLDNDQRQKIAASLKTPAQRKAFSDTLDIVERNPGIMGQATMPGH